MFFKIRLFILFIFFNVFYRSSAFVTLIKGLSIALLKVLVMKFMILPFRSLWRVFFFFPLSSDIVCAKSSLGVKILSQTSVFICFFLILFFNYRLLYLPESYSKLYEIWYLGFFNVLLWSEGIIVFWAEILMSW